MCCMVIYGLQPAGGYILWTGYLDRDIHLQVCR